jgi:hypothetical protein
MEYVLLCRFEERQWDALPDTRKREIMDRYGDWEREIGRSGHARGSAKLAATSATTTVRARDGKPFSVDGPFAETKEQLGGFHVVDCANVDEAVALAKRIPTLDAGGVVEVRPLERFHRP